MQEEFPYNPLTTFYKFVQSGRQGDYRYKTWTPVGDAHGSQNLRSSGYKSGSCNVKFPRIVILCLSVPICKLERRSLVHPRGLPKW